MHDFGTLPFRRTRTIVGLEGRIGVTLVPGELLSDVGDMPVESTEGTIVLGTWLDLEHDAQVPPRPRWIGSLGHDSRTIYGGDTNIAVFDSFVLRTAS